MNDLLKTLLPGIATALGGPLAGMAAGWLASKLGVPADQVQNTIAGMNADQLVKMKEMDLEFQKFMAENGIKLDLAQIAVNQVEAASTDKYTSRARPTIMWICAFGLAYATVILPVLEFFATVVFGYKGKFPMIDWALLSQVMIGILGLGAMRSYDKKQGTG